MQDSATGHSFRASAGPSFDQRLRVTCQQVGQGAERTNRIVRLYEQTIQVPIELSVVPITTAERQNKLVHAGQRLLKLCGYRRQLTKGGTCAAVQVLNQPLGAAQGRGKTAERLLQLWTADGIVRGLEQLIE